MSQTCNRCYRIVARACQNDAASLDCPHLARDMALLRRSPFPPPGTVVCMTRYQFLHTSPAARTTIDASPRMTRVLPDGTVLPYALPVELV